MHYGSLQPDELIRICAQVGEAAAWEEFIRRFNPLIASVVLKTARRWGELSPAVVDDLVQDTYLKLCAEDCRILRSFEPRGPGAIYGFLKVVAANVANDHFKAAHAAKRGSGDSRGSIEDGDSNSGVTAAPSPDSPSSIERAILCKEIDRHLARSLPAADLSRSRLIFWLHYRSGLSASAIASLPGIGLTTKGVESALLRLTRLVRNALNPGTETQKDQENCSSNRKGFRRAESF